MMPKTRLARAGRILFPLAALTALVSCSFVAQGAESRPKGTAFVFGVSEYKAHKLTFPDDDAVSLSALLNRRGWISKAVVNSNATKAAIKNAIEVAAANLDSSSSFLFYFSGHGEGGKDKEACIIPYDGIKGKADLATENWISASELKAWTAKLPTKNVIVILDTCYSGGFIETGASLDLAPQNYGKLDDGIAPSFPLESLGYFNELLARSLASKDQEGPLHLSAAGSDELSFEADTWSHGVFTYFLLEAAEDGDEDGDGKVSALEAFAYAKRRLADAWNKKRADWLYEGRYMDYLPRASGGFRDLVLYE